MKKHALILTFAFTFLSVGLFSQVNLGFSAGINSSKVSASDIAGFSPTFKSIDGTRIAALVEFELTEKFSIQPEIAYTSRGFKIKEGLDLKLFGFDLPLGVEAVTKFKYVEVPLLAKYKFGNKAVKAYVIAGPSVGYATKGKLKTKASFIVDIPLKSSEINLQSSNIQRVDLSGVIGAGLDFNVGKGSLFLDARYTHGFSKMDNLSIADLAVHNRNFGVSVGYKFQIN